MGISIRAWWGIKLVRGLDLRGLNISSCLPFSAHVSLFIQLHRTTRSRKRRSLRRLNTSTSWRQRGSLPRTAASRVLKPEAQCPSGCLQDDIVILHVTYNLLLFNCHRRKALQGSCFCIDVSRPLKGFQGTNIYISPTLLTRILVSTLTTWRLVVMPNNSPLRRLSVALRLTEAYPPTQILPPTPSSRSSLSTYLANAKDKYLKDIKEDPKKGAEWTVVMGNEAGGMIVCFTVSV